MFNRHPRRRAVFLFIRSRPICIHCDFIRLRSIDVFRKIIRVFITKINGNTDFTIQRISNLYTTILLSYPYTLRSKIKPAKVSTLFFQKAFVLNFIQCSNSCFSRLTKHTLNFDLLTYCMCRQKENM